MRIDRMGVGIVVILGLIGVALLVGPSGEMTATRSAPPRMDVGTAIDVDARIACNTLRRATRAWNEKLVSLDDAGRDSDSAKRFAARSDTTLIRINARSDRDLSGACITLGLWNTP